MGTLVARLDWAAESRKARARVAESCERGEGEVGEDVAGLTPAAPPLFSPGVLSPLPPAGAAL